MTTLHVPNCLFVLSLILCPLSTPGHAQAASLAASSGGITRSCAAEALRLCPGLDAGVPQPRGLAICLRPYKSSLSPQCRRAVRAASP